MHYRRLGRSGLKVSEISLGAWVTFGNQIKEEAARELIHAAYDQGVNFFDNADMYASGQAETVMGEAIKDLPREALVISSKVFWPTMPGPNGRGLSRKHIFESVHASLRRLGTDYLDLYFCHRYDPDTPVEEVVRIMNDLMHQGKILYWGTSEWDASQVAQAIGIARQYGLVPPTMEQPQYNLFHRQRVEVELAPICKEFGLGLTTWSPLAFGILSGKYNEGIPDGSRASMPDMGWIRDQITPERIVIVRQLTALARELGWTT
ncbi:MAG TPA: aldo/keto reductase, partial [Anaerolineaceae bacterium]|nr:aldo/keto reductase [Anaerolineaceae bacterium]